MRMTIIDRMRANVDAAAGDIAFRFLSEQNQAPSELTQLQLLVEAEAIAAFLLSRTAPGSRIMLFYPPGLDYVKAFYGCLLAGMVAVPLYPPRRNVKSDRVVKVAMSSGANMALTTSSELPVIQSAWDQQNQSGMHVDFHATDCIAASGHALAAHPDIDPATPAFLQYTSGSTGSPKGVIITHDNIIANMRHLCLMSTGNANDVFVNWLPLFHDLGLVTAVLWPVFLGAQSNLMSPASFVRNPLLWLKAITHYRGSMCGAPNFAYDLCANKIADVDLAGLDLSSWRVAYNAAEPVRAETLDHFAQRFAPTGFRARSFYPSYGMAEATVFVTGGEAGKAPIVQTVHKKDIAEQGIRIVGQGDKMATRIVACGAAHAPHDVQIVDPAKGTALAEGKVGEIWFSGPSVSPGYWQLDELNKVTFGQRIVNHDNPPGGYLRTGDLGVKWQGEIYVTGRLKDMIILRGANYYPQDIEASVEAAHPAIRAGYVAAFSLDAEGEERLVVVAEVEREQFRNINADVVVGAIRTKVAHDHEINVDQVILLRPYKIPMTSSGKIQRRQTRRMLLDGEFETLANDTSLTRSDYVAPGTATEQSLCEIWKRVLRLERVGVQDNFLSVGGDSMAAIEVLAQMQNVFGLPELEPELLIERPTIEQLASWIDLKLARLRTGSGAAGISTRKTMKI